MYMRDRHTLERTGAGQHMEMMNCHEGRREDHEAKLKANNKQIKQEVQKLNRKTTNTRIN